MIVRLSKIFLIYFVVLLNLCAQQRIKIIPESDFLQKELSQLIKNDSLSGITDAYIKRLLFDLGYCNASIVNNGGTFEIYSGEQTFIIAIQIDSLKFSGSLLEEYKDIPFTKNNVEELISKIIKNYSNNGYPFCKIIIDKIDIDAYKALLFLTIEKGKYANIQKFQITGNENTKDYVILRNISVQQGDEYSQEKINQIKNELLRLRLFKSVTEPAYFFDNEDNGVLNINVEEQNTNYFDGILGYVPDKKNNNNYFTGFVELSFLNLFGTQRELKFNWKKIDRNSQFVKIGYKEPWILGYPVDLGFNFEQYKQDSTYINRNYSVFGNYSINKIVKTSFIFDYVSTIPGRIKNQKISDSKSYRYGFKLEMDTRDNVFSPTRGIYFSSLYQHVDKKIQNNSEDNFNQKRYEFTFEVYQKIYKSHLFMLGLNGKELEGSFIEESDLFRLGGFADLRGYRENQFLGNRLAWTNIEYRYLLDKRTYAFLFYDIGYIKNSLSNSLEVTKKSFGFGINIQTNLGILGVRYAVGEDDSFNNGKIHFGIINEF